MTWLSSRQLTACRATRPTFSTSPATCSAPGLAYDHWPSRILDTTSDFAEIVLAILGVAAKLEYRRIKDRTARGRADAKAKGVIFGRKPKLTPHQQREAIRRRNVEGETLRSIGRSYNVSAQTISRLV